MQFLFQFATKFNILKGIIIIKNTKSIKDYQNGDLFEYK